MRKLLAFVALLVATSAYSDDRTIAYQSCAKAPDPPKCLVALTAPRLRRTEDLIEAIVLTGSTELIEKYEQSWTKALRTRDKYAPDLHSLFALRHPRGEQSDYNPDIVIPAVTAAVALAAAADLRDDPFAHPLAARLSAAARHDNTIATMASLLSRKIDVYQQRAGDSPYVRQPGVAAIWRKIAATPQYETTYLFGLAGRASISGYPAEGLTLLRHALSRSDATGNDLAFAAASLAMDRRIDEATQVLNRAKPTASPYAIEYAELAVAEARLHERYDPVLAQLIVNACQSKNPQIAFRCAPSSQTFWQSYWTALEAAGAKNELKQLAAWYLEQARTSKLSAEYQGQLFASASESFRRAGDTASAIAAAREALPLVAPAVAARRLESSPKPATLAERNRAAVESRGFGTEPVVALYRAGAREEALTFGYLTGYDRYQNAQVAGEQPDPQWVVDDRDMFTLKIVTQHLVQNGNVAEAKRLYGILSKTGGSSIGGADTQNFAQVMGSLAAIIGDDAGVRQHFAAGIMSDEPQTDDANRSAIASFNARHATLWHRALVVLTRRPR